jgi:hypothetical protein
LTTENLKAWAQPDFLRFDLPLLSTGRPENDHNDTTKNDDKAAYRKKALCHAVPVDLPEWTRKELAPFTGRFPRGVARRKHEANASEHIQHTKQRKELCDAMRKTLTEHDTHLAGSGLNKSANRTARRKRNPQFTQRGSSDPRALRTFYKLEVMSLIVSNSPDKTGVE